MFLLTHRLYIHGNKILNKKEPNMNSSIKLFNQNKYQQKWEDRSSVRTRPRKIIDFNQGGSFFPEDKQPLLINLEVAALGQDVKQDILLQSFVKYLNDIIHLEIKYIISACTAIIHQPLPIEYSQEIKLNTYTVMIDEYYHVYVAQDMLLQIEDQFPQRVKFTYPNSDAHYAVEQIKSKLNTQFHAIFEILAVCIFETTLVRELVEFFNSSDVHPSIKYYVNDHMNDEARHYQFFYDLLAYTWRNLPEDYKKHIGIHLAEFIQLYLNVQSDKNFYYDLLNTFLKDASKTNAIINDLYKGFAITPEIPIVKNVLNVFKKTDLLSSEYIKAGFNQIGWIF